MGKERTGELVNGIHSGGPDGRLGDEGWVGDGSEGVDGLGVVDGSIKSRNAAGGRSNKGRPVKRRGEVVVDIHG